jgi:hypothetical protein
MPPPKKNHLEVAMQSLQEKFETASGRYFEIKASCESNVSRWEWTTHNYYELEPYYHERNGFPKGRRLKEEPSTKNHVYQYGFDADQKIYVAREWFDLYGNEAIYEEFYMYENNLVERFYFGYSDPKELVRMSQFKYAGDGRLLEMVSYNNRGTLIETKFFYEGDKLTELERKQPQYANPQSYKVVKERFIYDENGELSIVKLYAPEIERVLYQRKAKGQKIDDTVKFVQGKLVDVIPKVIKHQGINAPIFAVAIAYSFGASDYFPPSIGIGTEEERHRLMEEYGKESIWNPAEYGCMLDLDSEISKGLQEQMNVLNTFFHQKDNPKQLEKVYNNIAKNLNNYDWQKVIATTDDFVVFAVEVYEHDNFKQNLKSALPKEKYDALKAKKFI